MQRIVGREIRKRGFFGSVFLFIFYAFNLLMLAWLVSYWATIGGSLNSGSSAEQVGASIGATLGTGFIFFFWAAGALITGLFAMLTRGKKFYVEEFSDFIASKAAPRSGSRIGLAIVVSLVGAGLLVVLTDKPSTSVSTPPDWEGVGAAKLEQVSATKVEQVRATKKVCAPTDFSIEGFKPAVYDDCRRSSCPIIKMPARLINNCAFPAGAMVKIIATDRDGNVVDTKEGWPASIRNIGPGEKYAFDLGPLMTYRNTMKDFSIQVIDAKQW